MPIAHPVSAGGLDDWSFTIDTAEYELVAGAYRWTGLIADAHGRIDVIAEAWTDARVRGFVRSDMRRKFRDLAPDKVIDGIIWRVDYDPMRRMFRLYAFAGGRRVEMGLLARRRRRVTGSLTGF